MYRYQLKYKGIEFPRVDIFFFFYSLDWSFPLCPHVDPLVMPAGFNAHWSVEFSQS